MLIFPELVVGRSERLGGSVRGFVFWREERLGTLCLDVKSVSGVLFGAFVVGEKSVSKCQNVRY